MKKRNTSALAIIMFYEMRLKNSTKYFRVLTNFIYTIIDNDVCIDYLACQSKILSDKCVDRKYLENVLTNSWV